MPSHEKVDLETLVVVHLQELTFWRWLAALPKVDQWSRHVSAPQQKEERARMICFFGGDTFDKEGLVEWS